MTFICVFIEAQNTIPLLLVKNEHRIKPNLQFG